MKTQVTFDDVLSSIAREMNLSKEDILLLIESEDDFHIGNKSNILIPGISCSEEDYNDHEDNYELYY